MPKDAGDGGNPGTDETLNLLVAEATGRVFVFFDVISNGYATAAFAKIL